MATFLEMFDSVLALITNTLILIVVTLAIGPVMDFLAWWLPSQPAGRIPIAPIQLVFGLFYAFLILLELALFAGVFLKGILRTDYDTGSDDF
jgi:uncharacterized membrane protein (DUF373 family)